MFLFFAFLPADVPMHHKLMKMKVLKFGGTSVGTAASIRNVKNIIAAQSGEKMVVLSAMSGVTNKLVEVATQIKEGDSEAVSECIKDLWSRHRIVIDELFEDSQHKRETVDHLQQLFLELRNVSVKEYDPLLEPVIVTYGEQFLTYIFSRFFQQEEINNTLLDAKKFMHISNIENPDIELVKKLLHLSLHQDLGPEVYITQGFVCIDRTNNINTLKRGGSDYSATIIAAALEAEEVQIWTDIDGFHNNDPRYVEHTSPISHLTLDEAAELAYFGAKILHPQTVSPIREKRIPLYLKDTFHPDAPGTLISSEERSKGLKAISAKDGITAIKIKSNRMLMAHGFLRRIFEVFDKNETSIDMITTSEIAISLTIDDSRHLGPILQELESFGEITVDTDHSIICVVGEGLIDDKNTFRLFEILNDVPVRMISYGGSRNNISLLVDTKNKIDVLRSLNSKLFQEKLVGEYC